MTDSEIISGIVLIIGALLAYGKIRLERKESKGCCKLK